MIRGLYTIAFFVFFLVSCGQNHHLTDFSSEIHTASIFTIQGEVAEGETLSVEDYGPIFNTSSAHQWFSDGVAIAGATAATLLVTAAEEGTTITLEIDGVQFSENSLITKYHLVFIHENNAQHITTNFNGTLSTYENLLRTTNTLPGRLTFQAGGNEVRNKKANSVEAIQNPGEYFELIASNSPNFTSINVGWSPNTSLNANIIRDRIVFNRSNSSRFLSVIRGGTSVYFLNSGNNGGTYRVTRLTNGFEITRNGTILYTD